MLKNGYSNFRLEILEYCDKDVVLKREQHYIYTLKPEYNILKIAGSLLGFQHSPATRDPSLPLTLCSSAEGWEDPPPPCGVDLMKLKHQSINKQISAETRIKLITTRQNGESVIVVNQTTGENISYLTIREASEGRIYRYSS